VWQGEMPKNMLHDPIRVLERVIVPNSDDAESLSFEPGRAHAIMRRCDRVLAAIDFDDQLLLEADEIDDISTNRSLASEFQAIELS
jgi:hypothetical protein